MIEGYDACSPSDIGARTSRRGRELNLSKAKDLSKAARRRFQTLCHAAENVKRGHAVEELVSMFTRS